MEGEIMKSNILELWGDKNTMNLENTILSNILSSSYYKVRLNQLKTLIEVVDEIYPVKHLEPWEVVSGGTSKQTGDAGVQEICEGKRVSRAFCILYKLFTMKLTRKQLKGLVKHMGSPYIRALGFMYIRYTQPPTEFWEWYEVFLDDREMLDIKAGTGQVITIGELLLKLLSKSEWFSTTFPLIPDEIQEDLEKKIGSWLHLMETYPPEAISLFQYVQDIYKNNFNYGEYINSLLQSEDPKKKPVSLMQQRYDLELREIKRQREAASKQQTEHSANQHKDSNHSILESEDTKKYEETKQQNNVDNQMRVKMREGECSKQCGEHHDDQYKDSNQRARSRSPIHLKSDTSEESETIDQFPSKV